jgi:hypothetical protein
MYTAIINSGFIEDTDPNHVPNNRVHLRVFYKCAMCAPLQTWQIYVIICYRDDKLLFQRINLAGFVSPAETLD